MSGYTELEKREINDLTHRIKEVHSPHIKNIDPITNDMIHLLHHDKELSSVYNKKTVLKASLHKIYIHEHQSEKHKHDNIAEIEKRDRYIDKRLFEEDCAKEERISRCRKSCKYSCTIL